VALPPPLPPPQVASLAATDDDQPPCHWLRERVERRERRQRRQQRRRGRGRAKSSLFLFLFLSCNGLASKASARARVPQKEEILLILFPCPLLSVPGHCLRSRAHRQLNQKESKSTHQAANPYKGGCLCYPPVKQILLVICCSFSFLPCVMSTFA